MRSRYRHGGVAAVRDVLKTKTEADIHSRARSLGVRYSGLRSWSNDELAALTSYVDGGSAACIKELDGRSKAAIRQKARSLGLTKRAA